MQLVYYKNDDVVVATASADKFRSEFGADGNPDIVSDCSPLGSYSEELTNHK